MPAFIRRSCCVFSLVLLATCASLLVFPASAQTASSTILPNVFSTVAGGGTTTTAGSPCATGSPYIAIDSYGDGCPATLASFSSDTRAGLAVGPIGNIYFGDTSNQLIRRIDPRSGLISVLVGGAHTICGTAVDKEGDGCPLANAGNFNNPRGLAADPYGNVLIAGYGDYLVHIVCNTVSPLCTAAQVGTMRVIAGCTTTTTAFGSATSPTPSASASQIAGDGTAAVVAGACSASTVSLYQPRGVSADKWGNVYIGDTGALRYRVVVGPYNPAVTNPLIAILQQAGSPYSGVTAQTAAGNIYALIGGTQFTVPAAGQPCFSGSASNALDGYGNGCPFFNTSMYTSGGFVQGIAPDAFGNVIFQDGQGSTGHIRVLYAGGAGNPMAAAITANNPTATSPQAGYVYNIAGGGTTNSLANTPVLGNTTSLDGSMYRTVSDAAGNIYIGDNNRVLFFDVATGYIRKLASSGTVCAGATDTIGDGCPATEASFGGSNSVLGLGLDSLGNLYIEDGVNFRVRKLSATAFAPAIIGTTAMPSVIVHSPAGTTGLTATLATNPDFTAGTATCVTNAPGANAGSGDNTVDCTVPITFTPTQLGLRSAPIVLQPTGGTAIATALIGSGTGPNLTFDPASPTAPSTRLIGSTPYTSVTVDGGGNLYVADSSNQLSKITAGTATPIGSAAQTVPQISVTPAGNVYYGGSAAIHQLSFTPPGAYAATTIVSSGTPTAITTDADGNIYYYESTSKSVVLYSPVTGLFTTLSAAAFSNVTALALDGQGNVLVSDEGAGAVYKLPVTGIASGLPPTIAVSGAIAPVAAVSDLAGDYYIADHNTGSILMLPVSGPQTTLVTGFSNITSLAIDGASNLYIADSATNGILEVLRNGFLYPFGTSITATLNGTLTNTGNAASAGFLQTDSSDFQLTGAGATCNPAIASVLPGATCTIAASFNPTATGTGLVTDSVTFNPISASLGSLLLTATKTGSVTTTTTSIGGETPATPVYVAAGTTATFTVSVAASTGTASGNVAVTLDSGAAASYPLNASGVATVALTGVTAGSHTLSATYATQGGIVGSTATPFAFTVAQAATAVTWTPATATQPFSQAIGTSVFNASSGGVAGAYIYTATPTAGSPIAVDSASYLPIGTYSLSVAFTPTDSTDYSGSSATVATYTVTQATTTAAVGASTNVVAADGSANFTNVTDAVAALPATGGTIYIAPGTYTGQFTISYPNVALRGLGGVAQNVILTAEHGAFNAPLPPGIAPGNNGAGGDQGSSTVVVDKQTINGTTYIPNNFYAENLSIINTWDTDATNSSTLATVGGVCTAGQAPNNNQVLYNAGTLCGSQALALWTRSDKAVFNNVRLTSLQDTLYAGSQGCGSNCVPARQYYWKGYITGDVDYIFGDAAMVFDQTTFYTTFHGATPTGTETIEAQNKMHPTTGLAGDYLSGYILNSANLTSQASGMTQLYFGRPYGPYSTFVMLNTTVDQVNPLGWIEFSGDTNLPTSTYAEYNTLGTGGATVAQREATSLRPESLTAAQAAQYAPLTFLSQGLPVAPDSWDPTAALTADINAYVPTGSVITINAGSSITILARPQTPGGGAIPTGTYTIMDGSTTLASGNLDASGSAYLTTSSLTAGTHNISFTYGGDSNFTGSTSSTPLVITVNPLITPTALALGVTTQAPTYGLPVAVTATLTPATATGSVALTVDGGAPITAAVTSGVATFNLTGLSAGTHSLSAAFTGTGASGNSTATGSVSLAKVNSSLLFSSSVSSTGTGQPVTFNVQLMAPAPTVQTGTIAFISGSNTLGTAPVGTDGKAAFTTSFAAAGTYPVVATYSGDANFNSVNIGPVTVTVVAPAVTLTANPTSLNISRGSTGTSTLTLTPVGNYQGTATFACSGLPKFATCTFTPATITLSGNNTVQTTQLAIATNVAATAMLRPMSTNPDSNQPIPAGIFLIPAALLGGILTVGRKRINHRMKGLLVLLLMATGMAALGGCGGSSHDTPTGSNTVTVTASITGTGGSASSTTQATISVNIAQ